VPLGRELSINKKKKWGGEAARPLGAKRCGESKMYLITGRRGGDILR